MLETPLISVIVPVHNSAAYLAECIQSILGQTFTSIEVIAINNGSTDESFSILEEIAKTDNRLVYAEILDVGVSVARNYGLTKARAPFIAFCDSDDFMETEMLEKMYNASILNNSDWVISNVNVQQRDKSPIRRLHLDDALIDINKDRIDLMRNILAFKYDYANWNKLYLRSIIMGNEIYFSEEMSIWEDLLFNLQYSKYVNRISLLKEPLYNYRIIETSLYNSGKKDVIPEYNTLYRNYNQFLQRNGSIEEIRIFNSEYARMTYFAMIALLKQRLLEQNTDIRTFSRKYAIELSRLDVEIFRDPFYDFIGFRDFNKVLLRRRYLKLLAFVVGIKEFMMNKIRF